MRLVAVLAGAAMLTCLGVQPGHAERRVALIIGNGDYAHADKLANPVTDARRMRDALGNLRFEIVFGENLGKQELERTIGSFADTAQEADVALIFFAGHGATFGDTPYVVPVDAQFSSLAQVPYELVPVETLIGELRRAKGLRIAILDACRDNSAERELKRKGAAVRGGEVTRGLARVNSPEGLILAYATAYLSTAADGDPSGDSPFTAALLKHIATPGLDVKDLFWTVGREVREVTRGAQTPEISNTFYDNYALAPAGRVDPVPPPVVLPQPDPAAQAWAAVKDTTSVAALEDFIRHFGDGSYGAPARARLDYLKRLPDGAAQPDPAAQAWEAVKGTTSIAALEDFIRRYGDGTYATRARARLDYLKKFAAGPPPVKLQLPCATLVVRAAQALSAAEECGLKPHDAFKECDKCPEMTVVPAGSFMMGSAAGEVGRNREEGPQHSVTISKPFAVGMFAVTFDEWDACVTGGGCQGYKPDDHSWGRGPRPVINVSWDDANDYVRWLSSKTGKPYRLLSEAEREYATRAGTNTPFWWGASISTSQANYNGSYVYAGGRKGEIRQQTLPVNSFQPNPFGLHQVHGNVWEWVEDCYHDTYAGALSDGSAWVSGGCRDRVVRGGAWNSNPSVLRAASRSARPEKSRGEVIGFRVARTL